MKIGEKILVSWISAFLSLCVSFFDDLACKIRQLKLPEIFCTFFVLFPYDMSHSKNSESQRRFLK